MQKRMSVLLGLESCTDMQANLKPAEISRIANSTKSGLRDELSLAARTLLRKEDDEIAVDGKNLDLLIREIKNAGAKFSATLGGNPAIEASQLLALGANVYFAGNFFQKQKAVFPDDIFFKNANMKFAAQDKRNPVSLILQHKSSRVILCDGSGRRMDDLRNCILSLPDVVRKMQKNDALDAISIPSWHVLFAGGAPKKDIELVKGAVKKIKKSGIMMFTGTGGFEGLSDAKLRMLWKIYGTFDVVGMNEFECMRMAKANNIPKSLNEEGTLSALLTTCGAHTIWLHTRDFVASASNKFGRGALQNANKNAAAAGALHVEFCGYPDAKKIFAMMRNRKEKRGNAVYGASGARQKPEFSKDMAFEIQRIKCEVGAGDVSSATYLWSVVQGMK